jgi:protein-S-isoprenylcysteine O-methyltransferase Ste14
MRSRPRLSPDTALALWSFAAITVHAGLPLVLSRRGRRFGWRQGRPGGPNVLGLIPISVGAAGLAWCYASHRANAPEEAVRVSLVPEYLVANGPYRFSRNPMYMTEQMIWQGWAIFFGSPVVFLVSAVLFTGMRKAVRREERTLERRFGSAWHEYARSVPRWL